MNLANKAYKHLTDKQQIVWKLVMQDCLSQYEAAETLGLTRECVYDRLNKAKRRYKKFIKDHRNGLATN